MFITTLRSENESLRSEIKSITSELSIADSTAETYKTELFIINRANARKDSVNQIISRNITEIHRVATDALKPKRWYERGEVWGGVGFIIGLIIAR